MDRRSYDCGASAAGRLRRNRLDRVAMNRRVLVTTMVASILVAAPARGNDERLVVSQASTGNILATVSANLLDVCSLSATSVSTQPDRTFAIVTALASSACVGPGPERLFSQVVDLGTVADGSYVAIWFYSAPAGPFGINARQPFTMRNGRLVESAPEPIPTLAPSSLWALVALVSAAVFAARFVHRGAM